MRMPYLTRTTFYLMIVLILCFMFHVPISFADPPPTQTDKPQNILRIGTMAPARVSYGKYMDEKLEELEKLTSLQFKFKLYPGGVLGDEPAMVKMVRDGELDGAFVSTFSLEKIAPEFLFLTLPYLFRDEYETEFIIEKYEPILAGFARKQGIEILALFPIGSAQIFSTVPISRPDKLRDKKLVCPEESKFFTDVFRTFRWQSPVPISFSEVESAFTNGKVEVVLANPASAIIFGWYPYIRYTVMGCFAPVTAAFLLNSNLYRSLPEEFRSKLTIFIREQGKKMLKRARRDDEIAMLGLMKRGVNIIRWSPEDMGKMRKNAKAFWDFGAGKWYPRKLLDDIVRDLEEYRAEKDTTEK